MIATTTVPMAAAAALIALGLAASPAAAQTVDEAAVEAACGALEREAAAGRARLVEVVACANREAARQLNPQLPLRVDEITTIVSVAAVGAEFAYNVRVNVDADSVTEAMRRALGDNTRAFVCNASDMRTTIGNGGSYRYSWSDRSGRPLHELLIARC